MEDIIINTSKIYSALVKFQQECPPLKLDSTVNVKTKSGGSYKFKYADLGTIHKTIKPILTKYGLGFTQTFIDTRMITTLIHESGEHIDSSFDLAPFLKGVSPQDAGGVISYFKRYTLSAILGLSSEDDDDGNGAAGNDYKKTSTKQPPKKTPAKKKEDDLPPITKWLAKDEYEILMTSDGSTIAKALKEFDGTKGKSMNKDYRVKLSNKFAELKAAYLASKKEVSDGK